MNIQSSIFLLIFALMAPACKTVDKEAEPDDPAASKIIPEEEVQQKPEQEVKQEVPKKQGNILRSYSSDRAARNNIPKQLKQMYVLFYEYDQDKASYPRDRKALEEEGYTTNLEDLLHPLKPRRTGAPIKTREKANSY